MNTINPLNNLKSDCITACGSKLTVPFFYNLKNARNQSTGFSFSERVICSVYGSAEIGFMYAAYLTATLGNDAGIGLIL